MNTNNKKVDFPKISAPYALIAITKHGCERAMDIAQKMQSGLLSVDLYFPDKFQNKINGNYESGIKPGFYSGKVKSLLEIIFNRYSGIVAIISLGALIRIIAPLLKDKRTDPALVVVDENAEYVISVLSGHIGGGNELCRMISEKIGARPVITTASDVQKTLAVDLLGKEFDWFMEPSDYLTEISAAVVNDETVAIVQESGEENWWPYETQLPENLKVFQSLLEASNSNAKYYIIITHREIQELPEFESIRGKKIVIFRPKVICIGLGCNRGTQEKEIENAVLETLHEIKFNINSVRALASIDLKKDEPGLLSSCHKMSWTVVFYSAAELNMVKTENPSETVFKHTGAYAVSEPAAKLYSGNEKLELIKKVSGNVTISVGLLSQEP